MDRRIGGDGDAFISCFDVAAYFTWLEKEKMNGIKFGEKPLLVYEKSRFEQCTPFWSQISPSRMIHEVENWIGKTAARAQPEDTINVFFFCHGNSEGGLSLGDSAMREANIAKLLAKVKPEVKTNVATSACYSGKLNSIRGFGKNNRYVATAASDEDQSFSLPRSASNRYRSSQFATALVDILGNHAGLKDPTVAESDDNIRVEMARLCGKGSTSIPLFLHVNFDPLTTSMDDRIFPGCEAKAPPLVPSPAEAVDAASRPDSTTGTEIDWENVGEEARQAISCSAKNVVPLPESSELVARNECARCETYYSFPPDQTVYSEMISSSPCWYDILVNLYWRLFRQARAWYMFNVLRRNGLIDLSALALPIDLRQSSSNTHRVCKLFFCFQVMQKERDMVVKQKVPLQSTSWTEDIQW